MLWLLESEARVIDKVVHHYWASGFLHPDAAALLILGATPTTVDDGIVIYSHIRQRHSFAIASIGEFEGIGAGIVNQIVGDIEFTSRLHVDGFTAISSIATICEDVVDDNALPSCKVRLVVIVVMEIAICHHKLAIYIAEMEGRNTAINSGLEEFVLERS